MNFGATISGLSNYPKLQICDYHAYLSPSCQVSLTYKNDNKLVRETIKITQTNCHYGNHRYWWLCPKCGKRVGVLYFNHSFVCRHCMGKSYASQLSSPLECLFMRLSAIHEKLLWQRGLLSKRIKPKGMHSTTYNGLIIEHDHLVNQVKQELIDMFNFSKRPPKKRLEDITLEDIFKELDSVSFCATVRGHPQVAASIPAIKAKLLGLDNSSRHELLVQPISFIVKL